MRNLSRGYHSRHLTLEPGAKPPPGLSHPAPSGGNLPQRTLHMAGASASAPSAPTATAPSAPAEPAASAGPLENRLPAQHSKMGGSRDSLLEMSNSGGGRAQKQGAGAYSKSYTLV